LAWSEIEALGIGLLGLSMEELYDLTPDAFSLAMKSRHDERVLDLKFHRRFVVDLINIQLSKKDRISPESYLPLGGDDEEKIHKPMTQKQINHIKNAWGFG